MIDKKLTFAQAWASYRELVMSADSPEIQVVECQQAFYSGAQALVGLVFQGLSDETEPTPEEEVFIESVHKELEDFARVKGWKPKSERT